MDGRITRAEHATTEETDEGQHADDEALAVTADRETGAREQQQEVEQIHFRYPPEAMRRERSAKRSISSGSCSTRLRSQGRSQPASTSNRSSDSGREAPHQHVGHLEGRTGHAARVPDLQPVRRIGELARWEPEQPQPLRDRPAPRRSARATRPGPA